MKGVSIIFLLFLSIKTNAQKIDTLLIGYNIDRPLSNKYSSSSQKEDDSGFYVYELGNLVLKDSTYQTVMTKVSPQEYYAYKDEQDKYWKAFGNCDPCWQKCYNKAGILIREGLYITDCPIGTVKLYNDTTGILKSISSFKYVNGKCSIPVGDWTYYNDDLTIKKIEHYQDGKLISTQTLKN